MAALKESLVMFIHLFLYKASHIKSSKLGFGELGGVKPTVLYTVDPRLDTFIYNLNVSNRVYYKTLWKNKCVANKTLNNDT